MYFDQKENLTERFCGGVHILEKGGGWGGNFETASFQELTGMWNILGLKTAISSIKLCYVMGFLVYYIFVITVKIVIDALQNKITKKIW